MYKISTDPLFRAIKVSGCGFLSVPHYLSKKQMCFAFEVGKKKRKVGGPCAETQKRFPQRKITGNLGVKPAIGPPASLIYSKHHIQLLFFFSQQYNERKNCITLTASLNSTKQVPKAEETETKQYEHFMFFWSYTHVHHS